MKLSKQIYTELMDWLKQRCPKAYLPTAVGLLFILTYITLEPWRIDIVAYTGVFCMTSGITLMITAPLTGTSPTEKDNGDDRDDKDGKSYKVNTSDPSLKLG